jgi:hypothetical protein
MARKVDDAANFVFVQLIEQEPGIYDKRHPDYARQDKVDLTWERISHEMKESDICIRMYIQIHNMSAKAMQTTTTVWPALCDAS